MLAQAPGSVDGRFKVTEQGEVIFARYGRVGHRAAPPGAGHLGGPAGVRAVRGRTQRPAAAAAFGELAAAIDTAAKGAFRALVEADGFAEWFAAVSPLEEIGGLRLGSRPSRRGHGGGPLGLEDLRAIPWVFAWAQTRLNLPGWYGLGSGLVAAAWSGIAAGDSDGDLPAEGLDALQRAYREWPLLATLLDNAEMSLAKTDREIAARYLALGDRPDLTERVLTEYDLTRRIVLAVTGHDRLVANRIGAVAGHRAARPVRGRAVLPAAARPDRAAVAESRPPEERAALDRLLLLTVSGVAAGLQNTG